MLKEDFMYKTKGRKGGGKDIREGGREGKKGGRQGGTESMFFCAKFMESPVHIFSTFSPPVSFSISCSQGCSSLQVIGSESSKVTSR